LNPVLEDMETRTKQLTELARVFLQLGSTAFGGPAAHIAMFEDEVVRRRGWLTREEFLDLLGATNLIPGPNSTELAIHVGYRRAGWAGLIVAGVCFILPAFLIVTACAWAYVKFGKLPQIEGLLYGVKPVIIAVIVQALWRLGRTAVKNSWLAILGAAAAAFSFLGVNELLVLFGIGVLPVLGRVQRRTLAVEPFSLWLMLLFFLKVGAVLFGSGYVLLAFLRADLVERWQWLTESQLLDAIAVGQVTPGPLFTTATFIGYLLAGTTGAVLATVGIFLPAFVFVAISGPLVPRLRASPVAGAFLDGVNVAALALMSVVTVRLSVAALVDPLTIVLAVVAAFLLLRYRVNSVWLVLGGAVIGLAANL
jgi:chromate transporter